MNINKKDDKYTVESVMNILDELDYRSEDDIDIFFETIHCAIWRKPKNFLVIVNENLSHLDDSMRIDQKILFIQYFKEEGRRTNGDEKRLKEVAEEIASKDWGNRPSANEPKIGLDLPSHVKNLVKSSALCSSYLVNFNQGVVYGNQAVAS